MDDIATQPESGSEPESLGAGATVLSSVFALLVGIVVGVITTFTHALAFPWAGITGLVIVVALVAGFRLVFDSRIVGAAAALGVLGALTALCFPGAGGVVLALDGPAGWLWTVGVPVVAAVVLLVPLRAHRLTP
ncbi:MAG TPA: hypothetical protein VGM70_06705 [Pseudolysinimonas sp.]|jgi:N-acetyl-1-D-myo-inositol-2-amino-2-deoxy-alpha-D-glucopyranoside deacetylase